MIPGSLATRPTVTALSPPAPPQFSPRCESRVDTPSELKRTMWKPSDHTRGFFRLSAPGWVGLYDMAVLVRRIFEGLRNHADVFDAGLPPVCINNAKQAKGNSFFARRKNQTGCGIGPFAWHFDS